MKKPGGKGRLQGGALTYWMTAIALAAGLAALSASCLAPCAWFSWLPIADVPTRCLTEILSPAR